MYVFEVNIINEGFFFLKNNQQHTTTSEKQTVHGYGLKKGATWILSFVLNNTGNIHRTINV